jgi:hypothetical protein
MLWTLFHLCKLNSWPMPMYYGNLFGTSGYLPHYFRNPSSGENASRTILSLLFDDTYFASGGRRTTVYS